MKEQASGTLTRRGRREQRTGVALLLLFLLLVATVLISAAIGAYPLSLREIVRIPLSHILPLTKDWQDGAELALMSLRLPRILMGICIGGGLSLAGACFQAVFRNPMVSPDVLGASSGAGFGAALGILLGFGSFLITLSAFGFGMLSIFLVIFVAKRARNNRLLGLILTGVVIGSLFSALLSLLKYVADPNNELPAITYWLMGSLNGTYHEDMAFSLPLILLGSLVILLLRWQLNVMTLGEESAKSIGLDVARLRLILLLAATLVTAAAVSVSGMIGWIGLVIPHFARMLVGSDHRRMLPASFLIGASFTLLVDDLARGLTTSEIPLGILTAFVGAPFFLHLIAKEGRK